MKQNTRISIAAFLSAAGSLLTALASEFAPAETADGGASAPAEPTNKPRGNKKTPAAPASEPLPVASETAAAAAAPESTEEPAVTGKTYEELRALIEPFVKDGKGPEVKKIIAKYATDLKSMEPKHHAAFEKDISALGY